MHMCCTAALQVRGWVGWVGVEKGISTEIGFRGREGGEAGRGEGHKH